LHRAPLILLDKARRQCTEVLACERGEGLERGHTREAKADSRRSEHSPVQKLGAEELSQGCSAAQ